MVRYYIKLILSTHGLNNTMSRVNGGIEDAHSSALPTGIVLLILVLPDIHLSATSSTHVCHFLTIDAGIRSPSILGGGVVKIASGTPFTCF